jgi:CPA1 family monovalent cation:H+ antiporter
MDVTGESLFNDGIGILAFVVLFHVWQGRIVGYGELCTVIFVRVLGGILMGVVLGYAANYLLRSIDHPRVQVLITLALAAAGYVLMMDMEMSGPLAIITAGLLVGHRLRHGKMGARSRSQLELFWEIMDEILNAVLFVLMGLEVLILNRTIEDVPHWVLVLAAAAVPLVLAARWISVAAPMEILRRRHHFARNAPWIMTWAALRGGVCIALALSLPQDTQHHEFVGDVILMMTYVVVAFSILVQGLTLRPVVAYLLSPEEKVS